MKLLSSLVFSQATKFSAVTSLKCVLSDRSKDVEEQADILFNLKFNCIDNGI